MKKTLPILKELGILTIATMIIAVAVFFFLYPSGASISSIAGLSIVLSHFIPLPISIISLIINSILLIIGFFTVGKEFGYKTIYTSLLLPVLLFILEQVLPNYTSMTGQPILDVAAYIFVVSIGLMILFTRNASSGGLDIVAMILHKYLDFDIGYCLSISGMIIACSSFFSAEKDIVILSIIGTYLNGLIVDHFIFNRNVKRRVCIVSEKLDTIKDFIIFDLHSGASIYELKGAFSNETHQELIAILDRKEYQKFMHFIKEADPRAFITVYNVSNMQYQKKPIIKRETKPLEEATEAINK